MAIPAHRCKNGILSRLCNAAQLVGKDETTRLFAWRRRASEEKRSQSGVKSAAHPRLRRTRCRAASRWR